MTTTTTMTTASQLCLTDTERVLYASLAPSPCMAAILQAVSHVGRACCRRGSVSCARYARRRSPFDPTAHAHDSYAQPPQTTRFTDATVDSFIYPFVNRFWLFLRDEQTREERTTHREALSRYCGTGTGLVLNLVVLELALTIGTRPVSLTPEDDEDEDDGDDGDDARAGALPGRESNEARASNLAQPADQVGIPRYKNLESREESAEQKELELSP